MLVMATSSNAVISAGPNLSPRSANADRERQDDHADHTADEGGEVRGEQGLPRRLRLVAIGYPSRAVITAGESPGIFSRIALNAPPYIFA
jgi:hypothetical protein